MRKTFLKVSILGMLTVGMAAGFTSCKDYDNDIDNLQGQIDAIQKDLKEIKDLVSSGVVITNVAQNADGVTITMSNNQTYTIKNGENGKPGKDADVWTIVKNDKGEYMWAKNDVVTEFPAQGPAGTAVAGTYYVPNAETGVFDEYKDGKLVGPTTIPCFAKGSLTAVDDGNNIIISGILDENGKETAPFILSKTGALSSLEFIPDLYVNGIETMETDLLNGVYQDGQATTKDEGVNAYVYDQSTGNGAFSAPAVIAKGQIWQFANIKDASGAFVTYNALANTDANYALNPANANLSDVNYKYITNDAEVRPGRASDAVINVNSTSATDGILTVNYSIANLDDVMLGNSKNGYTDNKTGKTLQTVAALQATLKDGSVVSSNFVALNILNISMNGIQYRCTPDWSDWNTAEPKAKDALTKWYHHGSTNQGNNAQALALPYDKVSNLPDYLRIATSYYDAKGKYHNGYFTLAEIAAKYGYTMNYSLLEYTIGTNATSENMYASVSADGKFQPMYVNAAGQSVPTTSEAGRSAIGRQPVVILQLKDAEGNVIIGGFVKVVLTEKTIEAEPINLGNVAVGYTCNGFKVTAPWDVFAGQVVESTGMTVTEFQNNYQLYSGVLGVVVDGKIVEVNVMNQSEENQKYDSDNYWNNFGTFHMDQVDGTGQTQNFYFTIGRNAKYNVWENNAQVIKTVNQYENWYPEIAKKDGTTDNGNSYKKGDQIGVGDMTKTPVTKTLYAKFYNRNNNSILWVGYTITLTGVPTVTYNGQLASQWNAAKTIVPAHAAIVSDAKYGAQANKITFTMASLWNGGKPALSFAAPYSTDDKSANYVGTTAVDYTFAVAQPSITTNAVKKVGDNYVNIVYGFIGDDTNLYGTDIVSNSTGNVLTGDDLTAALNAAKGNNANLFATLTGTNGDLFTITAGSDMVNQVVNTNAFSMTDPTTLFNVEMNLTYGSCGLKVPAFGDFQVGIGRPVDVVDPEKIMEITDGGADYTRPLCNLAVVQDWQKNKFWKTTMKDGKVTKVEANVLNGQDVFDFWMGTNGNITFGWGNALEQMTDANKQKFCEDLSKEMLTSTTPDVKTAVKGARKGFIITFGYDAETHKNYNQMSVSSPVKTLLPCYLEYQKYGEGATTVTEPFYIFVPVWANYVWGKSNIGYATIKIMPTDMGK